MELALKCQSWAGLPEPGGLLDQPLGLMAEMEAAYSTYQTYKALENNPKEMFKPKNIDLLTFITDINKDRENKGQSARPG